jgi:hypothetical protein
MLSKVCTEKNKWRGAGSNEWHSILGGGGGNKNVSDYEIRGSVVVKALCYKLEGRRFETR